MILFWLEHGPQHHLPCTLKAAVVSYVILCSKHGVTFDEKHKKKKPQKNPNRRHFHGTNELKSISIQIFFSLLNKNINITIK